MGKNKNKAKGDPQAKTKGSAQNSADMSQTSDSGKQNKKGQASKGPDSYN